MTITIIGHGYVGLVTAAVFADLGNTVYVIGRNEDKLAKLRMGDPLFYEPGLAELLKRNLDAKRLIFTSEYDEAIKSSKVAFICVGTPPKENGEADLSNVLKVAGKVGENIKDYIVIACKSTVPVGTNFKIKKLIEEDKKVSSDIFDIASCPEFLREGSALSDTMEPDRIVIGTQNKKAEEVLLDFHKNIPGERVLTSIPSAEMIKYASNSLLATKISFANMIAFLSEKVGADAEEVLDGVGLDNRIGRKFLYPGAGYGGSCFPKDVMALIKTGEANGESMKLLKAVEEINELAYKNIIAKVERAMGKSKSGKTIAVLGLSFKPNTDDLRFAPSLNVLKALSKYPDMTFKLYDPIVTQDMHPAFKNMIYSQDPYDAAHDADIMLIMTEWNEFRELDMSRLKKEMKGNTIVDARNVYEPKEMKELGFTYYGVGR